PKSKQYLRKALAVSPKLVFPFRWETIPVLKWALKQNSSWKTKYYLGLIMWSKGRNDEAMNFLNNCGDSPDFAPFYLTRSKMRGDKNPQKSLRDLNRSLALNKGQWRTYRALSSWYEAHHKTEKAVNISGKGYKR